MSALSGEAGPVPSAPLVLDAQKLCRDLQAVVYTEAMTKLQIYQRGQRLNAAVPVNDRRRSVGGRPTAPPLKSAKGKQKQQRRQGVAGDERQRGALSEKVLNEIKLQRELDVIIGVYELARQLVGATGGEEKAAQAVEAEAMEAAEVAEATECAASVLGRAIAALQEDNDDEERLDSELRQNQARLKALKAQLEADRVAGKERLTRQLTRVTLLLSNLHSIRRLNDLEISLVQRWEENRRTQAAIVGENAERALLRRILELRRRHSAEQRTNCEMQSFQGKQLADYAQQIADWQRRYASEMAKQLKQLARQADRERLLAKQRERHEETYAQRLEFVRVNAAQAAEEQRLLALEQHRIDCAVRIQAWWRGTMVRRGLGPYKKKSKKGKKARGSKAAK